MTANKDIQWTGQQIQAIRARGRNVLVTASAGTGKTAVLSGRCANLVSDVSACPDVRSILVLTFTEAAAEQMRSRIAQQLRDAFRQNQEPRLARQLILLQGADISTIHAFCKRLITEHFHALSLDPSFRIIDGDEAMLLKAEVLRETVEWAWQQHHLAEAMHALLSRRDLREGDGFLGSVVRLHDFLDGVASRDRWYDRARQFADAADPSASDLGREQQRMIEDRLDAVLAQLRCARSIYETEVPDGKWGTALREQLIEPIASCLERLRAGDWQGCAEMIHAFEKPKLPQLRGFPKVLGDLVRGLRMKAMGDFAGLRDLAIINPRYLEVVGRSTSLQTKVLIELAKRFDRLYARKKSALNGLDFADLEHCALRLLTEEGVSDEGVTPSEIALALRNRYKYIFVDEYQDINPVQQAILDALSSNDNVFVVGDVKQSIYGWRGAEPTIFLERLAPASVDPHEQSRGFRVDLNFNFRSAKGILDFVNKVFGRIMTSAVACIDYDDAARLRPAPKEESKAPAADETGSLVELHVLDEKADKEDANADGVHESEEPDIVHGRQRQAMLIAERIKEMVRAGGGRSAFQIYDTHTDSYRDVEYRDIVVLMRSLAKKANDYVEIFRLAGIPVSCDATAGYFEATEINDVLCLLKVLDNPQRDIEWAAVLRSPFFSLNDSELTRIRLHGQSESDVANFYACAVSYRDAGPDAALKGKLRDVFGKLDRWRSLARRGHLADLLWRIYRETQYLAFVSALPNGQARKANLLKLHDRAVQFEGFASSAGIASLTRFVAFVEKLQEAGQDWASAQPGSAADNAVRILSVHKSKGLEFPVIFLAELESEFNKRDIQADLIVDTSDTLGLQIIDRQSNTKLRSLAHQVIAEKRLAAGLAEEMRILYVATTRARDRLILTASQKRTDCGGLLVKGLLLGGDAVPDWLLRTCKSSLEWILYGLADQRVLHKAFETGFAEKASEGSLFDFTLYGPEKLKALSQQVLALRARKATPTGSAHGRSRPSSEGRALLTTLKERLDWQYPFADATHMPAKRSVTDLTHRNDEFARLDYSGALNRQPVALAASEPEAQQGPDARLIGTATHLVIAGLDVRRPVTGRTIEEMKARLVTEGAMTSAVAEKIDVESIMAFFESDLGRVVRSKANTVYQEWPFTCAQPASEPVAGAAASGPEALAMGGPVTGELVVVQGIIDLLVQTSEGLIVIDFKTDRVPEAELDRRADAYRGQLTLYAKAAGGILKRPVLAKWLYFLTLAKAVEV